MRTCSYCGKQYPDDAEVCVIDQQPLAELAGSQPVVEIAESPPSVAPARVSCPQCGAADDFTPVFDPHSSFSLLPFLAGGLLAVIFRNAGRPKRVRCNKCKARFY